MAGAHLSGRSGAPAFQGRPALAAGADQLGDGILDLALIIQTSTSITLTSAGAVGQTVIMTGNGDGTFQMPTTALTQTFPVAAGVQFNGNLSVTLGDLNKDGAMDIITPTRFGTFIFWGKPGSK